MVNMQKNIFVVSIIICLFFSEKIAFGQLIQTYLSGNLGLKINTSYIKHQFNYQPNIFFEVGFKNNKEIFGGKAHYFGGKSKDKELMLNNFGYGLFYSRNIINIYKLFLTFEILITHNFSKLSYQDLDQTFSHSGFGISPGLNFFIRRSSFFNYKIYIGYLHTFIGEAQKGQFGNIGGINGSIGFYFFVN